MARGKSQKTKVKEAASLSVPLLLAEKEASQQAELKKPWSLILKEDLGHIIKNIKISDIIELSAWVGLAIIIKPILDTIEEIQLKIQLVKAVQTGIDKKLFYGVPVTEIVNIILPWFSIIPAAVAPLSAQTEESIKKKLEQTDWQTWLLALAISALIIKFGPAILESFGGMSKIARLLLT